MATKRRRWYLSFIGVPMMLFLIFMATGEKIIGAERFRALEHSPWVPVAVVAFVILVFAASFRTMLKPLFSFFGGGAKRILATGRPAKAKVLAVGENSGGGVVTINDQPYLNLKLEINDGAQVTEASIDVVVPRYAVPRLQPGAELNIMLDRENPAKMAVDWSQAFGTPPAPPASAPRGFGPAAPTPSPAPAVAKRRSVNLFPVVFLSAVPVIVWALLDEWGPRVLGEEETRRLTESGIATGVGIVLMLIPVAAALAVFAKPMLSFFGGGEKRIRATGRPGRATLLSVGENSGGGVVTVNDQPYLNLMLRVDDGVRAPYDVSIDTLVPRSALPQFQPGAVVAVKIDAQNPNKVVLDW